jgi:hypothetical protein
MFVLLLLAAGPTRGLLRPKPSRRRPGVLAWRRRRRGRRCWNTRAARWRIGISPIRAGESCSLFFLAPFRGDWIISERARSGKSPLAKRSRSTRKADEPEKDAAPGEPEEGTPKLKPRADTFDMNGPAL